MEGCGGKEKQRRTRPRRFIYNRRVNALEHEKAQGRAGRISDRLVRSDDVILDELGYLSLSGSGGTMLVCLPGKHCERTSVIITTNLSFGEWATVFGESRTTRKGEALKLDERLTRNPSSSRITSHWRSRVKSRWKSTHLMESANRIWT